MQHRSCVKEEEMETLTLSRADRRAIFMSTPAVSTCRKRLPVPEVARHLVCSKCGARNSETSHPIGARPDARVGGMAPDFVGKKD